MVLFCPTCHKLLLLRKEANMTFYCSMCPYKLPVEKKLTRTITLTSKKKVEAVEDEVEKFGSRTQAICPKCGHGEAFFNQIQIRSSDEPMTTFYMCCECRSRWKEQ